MELTRKAFMGMTALAAGSLGVVATGAASRAWAEETAASVEYTVAEGDNLWDIQQKTGVSWVDIAEFNGIDPAQANMLEVGSVVAIPQDKVTTLFFGEVSEEWYTEPDAAYTEEEVWVPSTSRDGVEIPAALVVPNGEGPFPAVVFCHGHGGWKDLCAPLYHALANAGYVVIAPDYPGMGSSKEPWTEQTVTNMVCDTNDCLSYLLQTREDVDTERLGLIGFSMGGRVAATIAGSGQAPYGAVALLSPYAGNGEYWMHNLFATGGYETADEAYAYAKAAGMFPHKAEEEPWYYSPEWFEELEDSNPINRLHNYKGSLLVVYGGKDDTVPAATSRQVMAAATKAKDVHGLFIDTAGHTVGVAGESANLSPVLFEALADFFDEKLA